jgi:hypothetical protein
MHDWKSALQFEYTYFTVHIFVILQVTLTDISVKIIQALRVTPVNKNTSSVFPPYQLLNA